MREGSRVRGLSERGRSQTLVPSIHLGESSMPRAFELFHEAPVRVREATLVPHTEGISNIREVCSAAKQGGDAPEQRGEVGPVGSSCSSLGPEASGAIALLLSVF